MSTLGAITLNSSFILYCFFYLPQLWHNLQKNHIKNLSFSFHALLTMSACADLYYAFGRIEQWQYRVVSLIMLSCVLIQHLQWYAYVENRKKPSLKFLSLSFFIVASIAGLSISISKFQFGSLIFLLAGWIERLGYLLYALPQIIKNRYTASANSINVKFVMLALCLGILDWTSALIYHWGSASIFGTPISILLHLWLLKQCAFQRFDTNSALIL